MFIKQLMKDGNHPSVWAHFSIIRPSKQHRTSTNLSRDHPKKGAIRDNQLRFSGHISSKDKTWSFWIHFKSLSSHLSHLHPDPEGSTPDFWSGLRSAQLQSYPLSSLHRVQVGVRTQVCCWSDPEVRPHILDEQEFNHELDIVCKPAGLSCTFNTCCYPLSHFRFKVTLLFVLVTLTKLSPVTVKPHESSSTSLGSKTKFKPRKPYQTPLWEFDLLSVNKLVDEASCWAELIPWWYWSNPGLRVWLSAEKRCLNIQEVLIPGRLLLALMFKTKGLVWLETSFGVLRILSDGGWFNPAAEDNTEQSDCVSARCYKNLSWAHSGALILKAANL